MSDHANLERLGIPTVTFVTQPFESAARTHAAIHDLADLPLLIVALDYLAEPSDDVNLERDRGVFDRVLEAITAGP